MIAQQLEAAMLDADALAFALGRPPRPLVRALQRADYSLRMESSGLWMARRLRQLQRETYRNLKRYRLVRP